MKYIPFCLILCLLMISCSSTPPAEQHEDVAPTESITTDAVQPEEVPALEEQTVQEGEDGSSQDVSSEIFPTTDFLELKENDLDDVALSETEYLQEIEIIDVDQEQTLPLDDLENMAMVIDDPENMVVEPEVALVVETPSDDIVEPIPEPLLQPDDVMALVVEEVVDTAAPDAGEMESLPELSSGQESPSENLPEAESQSVEPIVEDESLLVEAEDAAVPEIVSQEQAGDSLEERVLAEPLPIDVNAIQGVVTPVEPSRTIIMDNQQFLDLRYPGNGWVYLGEVTTEGLSIGTPNFTYFGRRRTSNDTNFTLRSIKSGSTILHFYKQDVLTATFIDDFVQVTITDKVAQAGTRVVAPNYGSVIPGYQGTVPQPSNYVQAADDRHIMATAESESSVVPEAVVSDPAVSANVQVPETIISEPTVPDTSADVAISGASVSALVAERNSVPAQSTVVSPAVPVDATMADVGVVARDSTPSTVSGVVPTTTQLQSSFTSPSAVPVAIDNTKAATATDSTDSVAMESDQVMNQQAPATSVVQADNQLLQEPVQNQMGALQIVPPRDSNVTGSSQTAPVQSQPEVSAVRQQEVYRPERTSSTASVPSNYNPQTGMSMERLQLPWVQEELERQRAADIQQGGSAQSETDTSVQQNQLEIRLEEQNALLAKAQECFYAEDYPASLDCLNQFFAIAVRDFDAAYYLKGQVLESKSSIRNIKEAQKAYKHVVDSYPQSPFWKRSKNRFTYLSRFYFDIR